MQNAQNVVRNFITQYASLLHSSQLYYAVTTAAPILEQFEFDGQVFFGVLAEVVDEFDGLGGELVDVVVELFVGEELAGGAFAALDAGDDVVDALGGGVEAGDGGAGLVVDGVVGEELAGGAAPLLQAVGDLLERAADFVQVVIERGVVDEA